MEQSGNVIGAERGLWKCNGVKRKLIYIPDLGQMDLLQMGVALRANQCIILIVLTLLLIGHELLKIYIDYLQVTRRYSGTCSQVGTRRYTCG